jgi:hypothetical protein
VQRIALESSKLQILRSSRVGPTTFDILSNMLYTRKNKGITWQRFI